MNFERGLQNLPPQPSRPPRPVERVDTALPGSLQIAAEYAKIRVRNPALSREEAVGSTMQSLRLPPSSRLSVESAIRENGRIGFGAFSSKRRLGYPYEKDDESE